MSMKNSKDIIGNQTGDLTSCSAVPVPTAPLRVPIFKHYLPTLFFVICRLEAVCSKSLPTWSHTAVFHHEPSFRLQFTAVWAQKNASAQVHCHPKCAALYSLLCFYHTTRSPTRAVHSPQTPKDISLTGTNCVPHILIPNVSCTAFYIIF
jgi:hypothetical protein